MSVPNIRSAVFVVFIQVLISGCFTQTYSDLEILGVNCPSRDRCLGYRNNLTYLERSCECDFNCTAYQDCCIDALPSGRSRPPARTDVMCLHYGEDDHTGVYVISKCSSSWNGPKEIREKCSRSDDLSDPLSAVPVTDVAQKETYRNLDCAECNNANLAALETFRIKVKCDGLEGIAEEQIIADLTYNQERRLWGVNRLNNFGNGTKFFGCDIIFDVPEYLNDSVRFCRYNLISACATTWNLHATAKLCAQYMAVVYSNTHSYRNPHCAICNHKTADELSCRNEHLDRQKRSRSPSPIDSKHFNQNNLDFKRKFKLNNGISLDFKPQYVDINPLDGGIYVGKKLKATPACPSSQIYDVFYKRCRQLVCALPGYAVVNRRCVRI